MELANVPVNTTGNHPSHTACGAIPAAVQGERHHFGYSTACCWIASGVTMRKNPTTITQQMRDQFRVKTSMHSRRPYTVRHDCIYKGR